MSVWNTVLLSKAMKVGGLIFIYFFFSARGIEDVFQARRLAGDCDEVLCLHS